MKIDVLLATYNRAGLLTKAVESFLAAAEPKGCEAHLYIIDNNSRDNTKQITETFIERHPGRISYFFEEKQGKDHALNTAIRQTSGDVVAFYDDDELLRSDWLEVIAKEFADPEVDFIGGPYMPNWSTTPPDWIPLTGWSGVLGIIDNGPVRRRYGDPSFRAMLAGGNAAIRRRTLAACGEYKLKYVYAQDRYMYERLMDTASKGYYVPDLVIYHYIPEKRMKKEYFRYWAYNEGRNEGRDFRMGGHSEVLLLGIPRWRWRVFMTSLGRLGVGYILRHGRPSDRFEAELAIRRFWGFFSAVRLTWIKDKYVDRA